MQCVCGQCKTSISSQKVRSVPLLTQFQTHYYHMAERTWFCCERSTSYGWMRTCMLCHQKTLPLEYRGAHSCPLHSDHTRCHEGDRMRHWTLVRMCSVHGHCSGLYRARNCWDEFGSLSSGIVCCSSTDASVAALFARQDLKQTSEQCNIRESSFINDKGEWRYWGGLRVVLLE